MRRNSWRSC